MKKLLYFFMLLVSAGFIFSCDDDNENSVVVNNTIKAFIEQKYEGAAIRTAEYDREGLLEVEFLHDGHIKDAYFNSANKWLYTEWDVALLSLPKVVTDVVAQNYPGFRIDDADFIETENKRYYEIEIDKGGVEQWIFVTTDGVIISNASEANSSVLSDAIKIFIEQRYPNARIVDVEYERNGIFDVNIKHDNIVKEVYFNKASEWLYTAWDVSVASLPDIVADAVAQAYPHYTFDGADFVESADGNYYRVEVERGNFEKNVYVTVEGEIITE